jgi:hypothetical protein
MGKKKHLAASAASASSSAATNGGCGHQRIDFLAPSANPDFPCTTGAQSAAPAGPGSRTRSASSDHNDIFCLVCTIDREKKSHGMTTLDEILHDYHKPEYHQRIKAIIGKLFYTTADAIPFKPLTLYGDINDYRWIFVFDSLFAKHVEMFGMRNPEDMKVVILLTDADLQDTTRFILPFINNKNPRNTDNDSVDMIMGYKGKTQNDVQAIIDECLGIYQGWDKYDVSFWNDLYNE